MYMKLTKHITWIILCLILILGFSLRFYKLESVPPSIYWDEAANGYNAYTIANYGRDEWNQVLPIYFHSFGDDKHPVHIYLTALFVKVLGLSTFSLRIPVVIFSVINIILVFFLAKILFKDKFVSLCAALFLSISPYAIQFSRFNQELSFVIFFFLLGLILFFKGLEKKNYLLILSFICFGIDLITYHAPKIVVPPLLLLLVILYIKDLMRIKTIFIFSVISFLLFIVIILLNPALLGTARFNQTSFDQEDIRKTLIYKKTHNELVSKGEIIWNQYLSHFSKKYLFETGDNNRRHSTNVVGEFYKVDVLFFIIGLFVLIRLRSKITIFLLACLLISPLPSAFVKEAPHASRAMFMLPSIVLINALGFSFLVNIVRKKYLKIIICLLFFIIISYEFMNYAKYYFNKYSSDYAIEWQYGMKEIVETVQDPKYQQVYITDDRMQPYIFFLYYLKPDPKMIANSILYNQSKSKSYSLIEHFDKYYFGNWDVIGSMPNPGVAYVVTPSQYSGLRERLAFDIKKTVYFPDGSIAFIIVSAK